MTDQEVHNLLLGLAKEEGRDVSLFGLVQNYRHGNSPSGKRLTKFGFKLLSKVYDNHIVPLSNMITFNLLIELEKNTDFPYFVNGDTVTFFSQEEAAWFQLTQMA